MEYAKSWPIVPFAFKVRVVPDGSLNRTAPERVLSVGLISTTSVVHPPPSANCGIQTVPRTGVAPRSTTGRVVIRNSDRSFVYPRNAVTATGTEELKVKVPLMDEGPLKGASLRNAEMCPFTGTVIRL